VKLVVVILLAGESSPIGGFSLHLSPWVFKRTRLYAILFVVIPVSRIRVLRVVPEKSLATVV